MFCCKQFSIDDSQCAMKVSTDALILGSWADPKQAKKILDIGCGSGILSLMMLQKAVAGAQVTGIDIHAGAVAQSRDNIANSPWSDQAAIEHWDVLKITDGDYDFIISNPPYFSESVSSVNSNMTDNRRVARHQSSLSVIELLQRAYATSLQNARLVIMYPYAERGRIIQSAACQGWSLQRIQDVKSKASLVPYLSLFEFIKNDVKSDVENQADSSRVDEGNNQSIHMDDLVIHDKDDYSIEFKALCRDFYLRF